MKLYHGTNEENIYLILKKGLFAGNDLDSRNSNKEKGILHLARDFEVSKAYGHVLIIDLPDTLFQEMNFSQAINGRGEFEYYLDDLSWNKTIIDAKYISCPEFEHFRNNECSANENCIFCYKEMEENHLAENGCIEKDYCYFC